MALKLCFNLNGRHICVDVPTLIKRLPFGTDPNSLVIVSEPRPDPWIQAAHISADVANSIAKMATLSEIAQHLGGDIGNIANQAISNQVKKLALPEGVSIQIT
jgi:hypothetical protein